jgi:hypothetical protein
MPTLGLDQFSLNGIPSDIEAMHKAFPFGFYQISNGMNVNVMTHRAWPTYSKYYGGYHFFQPNPDGNWIYQNWEIYAEACAYLFLDSMKGNYGATPMIDVEAKISESNLDKLYPTDVESVQHAKGNALQMQMLRIICDIVDAETKQTSIIYTGKNYWEAELGGANQAWAASHPLMVANYPFDLYSESAYLSSIKGVMNGVSLPNIPIPKPWTKAKYIQFTGRAPISLVPGYSKESNWAKTVDMSVEIKESPYPAYKVKQGYNLNVRYPDYSSPSIGLLLYTDGIVFFVDTVDTNTGYSHFQPTTKFPKGGWVWSAWIEKV